MFLGEFVRNCVELVTLHGLPFRSMEFDSFKKLIKPYENAFNVSINAKIIKENVSSTADSIRLAIKNDLENKLFSIKFDTATRYNRSILGINVQFIKSAKICIATLGMVELKTRHTGENLKNEIDNVLQKYGFTFQSLYSGTVDSGRNMIKALDLINDEQKYLIDFEEQSSSQSLDSSSLSKIKLLL